jgi:NAD(P)-dependent dehydrogenase (short-subunit alcohol dehydrogenase family)
LNIPFNNAGVVQVGKITETSEEDFDRVMGINVKGAFLASKYAIPELLRVGGGAIINTGSIYGDLGAASFSAYCASKGAVQNLTRAMAMKYPDKIRMNSSLPAP